MGELRGAARESIGQSPISWGPSGGSYGLARGGFDTLGKNALKADFEDDPIDLPRGQNA